MKMKLIRNISRILLKQFWFCFRSFSLSRLQFLFCFSFLDHHNSSSRFNFRNENYTGGAQTDSRCVCLCYLPLHHNVQKFSSGTSSPGWSRKKGRKMVVVVLLLQHFITILITCHYQLSRSTIHRALVQRNRSSTPVPCVQEPTKRSNATCLRSLLVDEERMRSVGDFLWSGSAL